MSDVAAIKVAIGLLHLPSSVRLVRSEPLPPGIESLLRIAAGDGQAETDIAHLTDRPPGVVREAAAFFIEQVLLSPDADNYRVLGATPQAPAHELRRNMALLLSWLHPDKNPSGERAVFAARVTGAWDTLRNPERRAAYDATIERAQSVRQDRADRSRRRGSAKTKSGADHAVRLPLTSRYQAAHHARDLFHEPDTLLRRGLTLLRRVLRQRPLP